MPSESEIIWRLRRLAGAGDRVRIGIGDDAAVVTLPGGRDLLACCDLLVEGIHFRTEWTTPRLLGRKALAVNLSDIAAMGGVPKFAMISIAIPHTFSSEFIDELFAGVFELSDASGVSIIGGDTSASNDSLFIDLSVIGECESGKAITRRGAKIGDQIYVSGSLGASALGLSLLEDGFRLEDLKDRTDARQQAIFTHLAPEPRLNLGRALGEAGLATSMIDISDGLSTDLWHILDESRAGAFIHAAAIPLAGCVLEVSSGTRGIDPFSFALNGGEDYELLFTVAPENYKQVMALAEPLCARVTVIGEIVGETSLSIESNGAIESLERSGYEHLI